MKNIKVVLIGAGGVGKTTLKKIFFDEEDPEELLNNPLEPTYGLEISNYNLGDMIGVHDLAGQQLEDWFENEHSVFFQTDLLLLILDARAPWEENEQLWLRLYRVCKKHHTQTFFGLLFHKIDLLSVSQRKTLENQISKYPFQPMKFETFLTSIQQEFFQETLATMIKLLKHAFSSQKSQFYGDLMKLNFLEKAVKKTAIKFAELDLPAISREDIIEDYFGDLEKNGLLTIDRILQQIRITQKGRNFVDRYSNRIQNKMFKIQFEESSPLLGFLLADKFGRHFFIFENSANFFKHIFDNLGEDIDPAMITGFFFATKTFGDQMNEDGMSSVEFRGQKVQIMILLEENIFGNFFMDKNVTFGSSFKEILSQFLKSFNHQFSKEIGVFMSKGDLNVFDTIKNEIYNLIQELNEQIKNTIILQNKAQKIYTDLSYNRQLDSKERKNIKKDLFNYILSNDEKQISPLKKRFFE